MTKIDDLARCDGVGRMTIERRLAALAGLLGDVERRLQDRADNAAKSADTHPDKDARHDAAVRELAYRTALADLRCLIEGVP